jgi:solute carrier family 1 (high affinity glutamate transporter) protein 2
MMLRERLVKTIKANLTAILTGLAIVLGFAVGITVKLKFSDYSNYKNLILWLTLPGKIFLRSLEAFMLPLIFVGVSTSTFRLKPKINLRLTIICLLIILATHLVACVVGIVGSLLFPVIIADPNYKTNATATGSLRVEKKSLYYIFADILYNLVPKNLIKSTLYQELIQYEQNATSTAKFSTKPKIQLVESSNVLGILFFAILIGMAAGASGKKGESFRSFMEALNSIITIIIKWLISIAPIGFASLIVDSVVEMSDLSKNFKLLGLFALIVTSCCLFYGILILSTFGFVILRKNPFRYYMDFSGSMLLGFTSVTSSVCIHKTIQTCEDKLKLDSRISRFCVPFYTAVQSDGSAIFIIASSIFLAFYNNLTLQVSDYVLMVFMTSVLCLSLPCVPRLVEFHLHFVKFGIVLRNVCLSGNLSASLITILIVLNSLNLGGLDIGLLYATEWLLDRVRTTVNVYSAAICTVITNKIFERNFESAVKEVEPNLEVPLCCPNA